MTTDATERLAGILLREHENSQRRSREVEAMKARAVATIGLRAANAPGVVAYRDALSRPGTPDVPEGAMSIASARDLADLVRVRTTVDAGDTGSGLVPESTRVVRVQPQPSGLLDLIDFLTASSLLTRSTFVSSNVTGKAAGSDEGTSAPALTGLTVSTTPLNLKPFAVTADVTRDHRRDRGVFARITEQIIRSGWSQALASDIVTGDGSDDLTTWHPTGVTNLAGVTTIPASGVVSGITSAVTAVQDAGYLTGLALVASPTTLLRVFTDEDGSGQPTRPRDLFPGITSYLPDPAVPVGTVVVGAFGEAAAVHLHEDGMSLSMARASGSNFLSGVVTLRFEANLAVDLAASGFAVVTGL